MGVVFYLLLNCHVVSLFCFVGVNCKFNIKDFQQALRSVIVFLVSHGHQVLEFVVLVLLHMYTLIKTRNGSSEVSEPYRFYVY